MTDRETRSRIVSASVVVVASLTLAASTLAVAAVDRGRRDARQEAEALAASATASPQPLPVRQPVVAKRPPARGLVPAPLAQRRVVYVRRTRAS